jgi:hypothetical protein
MDDLVPFLIFLVVVIINLVKFAAQRAGKKKKTPPSPGTAPPKRQPSSIEAFFEDLAAKLEPQPTELADWPEGRERPDYMKDMEELESVQTQAYEEERAAETTATPPPEPVPAPPAWEPHGDLSGIQPAVQAESLKMAMKSMPSTIASLKGLRMATPPILRSSSAGRVDFPLDNKAELKTAIIANLIFSPPRACDATFANTIAK